MRYSRENNGFWLSILLGALIVTVPTTLEYGALAIPLGVGTGASLGMVVFYLASMLASGARWIGKQLKRP